MAAIIIILLLLIQLQTFTVHSQTKINQYNCTSSCGHLQNISFPFRVKGDPENCGDKRYELDCENNNITTLSLSSSAKYYVQAIDYTNFTIRLVDPGFVNNNHSYPRYFFNYRNISYDIYDIYEQYFPDSIQVFYLRCREAVNNDPSYVKIDDEGSYYYDYARVVGLRFEDLRIGCHVKMIVWAHWKNFSYGNIILSYSEIQAHLVDGFLLSWIPGVCQIYCGANNDGCYLSSLTGKPECSKPDCKPYHNDVTLQSCGKCYKET